MVKEYWRQVHRRAFADAAHELHIESRGRLVIALISALAAVVALFFWGSADASRDEMIARAGLASVVILLFPFVYLWKFLGAPARMAEESDMAHEKRLSALETEIASIRADLEPRMIFRDKIDYVIVAETTPPLAYESARITIHNAGGTILEKCLVKVESVWDDTGWRQDIHQAIPTEMRHIDGRMGRFTLGAGESKKLVFTNRPFTYQKTEDNYIPCEQAQIMLPREKTMYVGLVAIAELGQPSRATFKVFVDEWYKIHIDMIEPKTA